MNDEEKQFLKCALCLIDSAKTAINKGHFAAATRYVAATRRNLDAHAQARAVHGNAPAQGKTKNRVEAKPLKEQENKRKEGSNAKDSVRKE